jgi:hypothetical protein
MALRQILTAKNSTKHRNVGTLDRILTANGKTRLRKQNCGWRESKNEIVSRIERL